MRRTACMTDDEWADWSALALLSPGSKRPGAPCADCTDAFAIAMMEAGRCDGSPGWDGIVGHWAEARRAWLDGVDSAP